ncbi:unnamed protein product [Prorocentrum cordatum]|uniref:Uncharacterized protein n=1 Tax=Prorocentrum cordatum TaxID=2364126 RepID=A0ABN9WCE6_9DINO|nr:unnamed protein product [Polarella glacialis]
MPMSHRHGVCPLLASQEVPEMAASARRPALPRPRGGVARAGPSEASPHSRERAARTSRGLVEAQFPRGGGADGAGAASSAAAGATQRRALAGPPSPGCAERAGADQAELPSGRQPPTSDRAAALGEPGELRGLGGRGAACPSTRRSNRTEDAIGDFFDYQYFEGSHWSLGSRLALAACFFNPQRARQKRARRAAARRALRGRCLKRLGTSRLPTPPGAARLLRRWLAREGGGGMAVAVPARVVFYLRPSEALGPRRCQLAPPLRGAGARRSRSAMPLRPMGARPAFEGKRVERLAGPGPLSSRLQDPRAAGPAAEGAPRGQPTLQFHASAAAEPAQVRRAGARTSGPRAADAARAAARGGEPRHRPRTREPAGRAAPGRMGPTKFDAALSESRPAEGAVPVRAARRSARRGTMCIIDVDIRYGKQCDLTLPSAQRLVREWLLGSQVVAALMDTKCSSADHPGFAAISCPMDLQIFVQVIRNTLESETCS